ncbi:MAG: DUF2339 domain-containing protein [Gloeomargarita sp. DG_2_bins_126]
MELDWLRDAVQVGMGFLMGTMLLGLGWRLQRRAIFSQFLQGGGFAIYYLTVLTAHQLLRSMLMPRSLVFLPLMVLLVTLGAFFISLRQNRAIFAVIGVVGGLVSLFLVPSISPLARAGYTFLILLGSWAIYAVKGWQSLLLSSFWLGWLMLIMFIGAYLHRLDQFGVLQAQAILALTWLGFTVLPPWYQYGQTIALFNPLIALGFSALLWGWSATVTARVFIVFGGLYLGTSLLWRRLPQPWRRVYGLTGLVLVAFGLVVLFSSHRLP